MRSLIRFVVVAISFIVAIGLAHPAGAQSYVPSDETKVHSMVNQTRASKGLKPLARNDKLVTMARQQADRMEAKGNIFHNPNLSGDINATGLNWRRVGENVGMGPNVDLIEKAFLASPGHYENIVRAEYNTMGIGAVKGDDGKMYVVQVFANVAASAPAVAPAAPKPATVAPAVAPASTPTAPAAAAPARVADATKTPAPKPAAPRPTNDLNALTGGYVTPASFTPSDQG